MNDTDDTIHRLTVKLDRRAEIHDDLVVELRQLADSVAGLKLELVDQSEFEAARDAGKFRDFVPIASFEHSSEEVLSWIVEELIDEYGWLVDFGRETTGE